MKKNRRTWKRDGRTKKTYYCKDCGIKIAYPTFRNGNSRCRTCAGKQRTGKNNPNYKKYLTCHKGYIRVHTPTHPYCSKNGHYVLEHRLIMEKKIGRYLKSNEIVHHLNGIRDDNRPENLAITTRKQHEKNTFIKVLQKRINYLERKLYNA